MLYLCSIQLQCFPSFAYFYITNLFWSAVNELPSNSVLLKSIRSLKKGPSITLQKSDLVFWSKAPAFSECSSLNCEWYHYLRGNNLEQKWLVDPIFPTFPSENKESISAKIGDKEPIEEKFGILCAVFIQEISLFGGNESGWLQLENRSAFSGRQNIILD